MGTYSDIFNTVLNEEVRDMLSHIYEPKIVATALADARRAMTLLPSGELREYGRIYSTALHGAGGQKAYLRSLDCGISWTLHYDHGDMGPCLYIPEKDLYIKAVAKDGKTYIKRSKIGPDDPSPEEHLISDEFYFCEFLPAKCEKNDRIFFTAQRKREDGINLPVFLYSDDFGESFTAVELPAPPKHEMAYPHKGVRWSISNGSEPCAVELGDGRMMMLIRTSTDFFYQSFSEDGGLTWSEAKPNHNLTSSSSPMIVCKAKDCTIAVLNPIPWAGTFAIAKEWLPHKDRTPFVLIADPTGGEALVKQDFSSRFGEFMPYVRHCYYLEDDRTETYCYPSLIEVEGGLLAAYYYSDGTGKELASARIKKILWEELSL